MGLAPYGEPRFADLIREKLVDIKADGSIRLDLSYFNFCHGLTMTSTRFHRLFGGPPRQPETEITQQHKDLAASIQVVLEEILLRMVQHVHMETQQTRLCMAGGVALNCVANGRILREGPFDEVWIQPAAGDAGGALGVAQLIWHQLLNQPRITHTTDQQRGSFLGPRFGDAAIQQFLDQQQITYHCLSDDQQLCSEVARLLAEEKVVGWFQGRMEFGPRALGGRSIVADPRSAQMQSMLNQKIKFRESFRPFAPAVLRERVTDYFDFPERCESPYMLQLAQVQPKANIPAVTHIDGSSRLQTVDAERHGLFYQLISEYEKLTGVPLLINTSFNVRGEPPVCTPQDAWHCFMSTDLDVLVLEHFVVMKSEQSAEQMQAARKQPVGMTLD